MPNFDVVIIGSGIAALTVAYKVSPHKNVIVLTKSKKTNSNSLLAQGGIASSFGEDDSWDSHYTDTMSAGCWHNRDDLVELLVKKGPEYISELISEGMQFDLDHQNNLLLGKEGAHSTRRILHAGGDATGKELVLHMLKKVKNNVQILEDEMAIDLILSQGRCVGVITKDLEGNVNHYYGENIILATGGCGGLYSFTSNDSSITGDGIAMAYRAGAKLADLEFIQFHPTLLNVDGKGSGLISEAVRGEGAILITEDGRSIMKGQHPLKDLAPRDIVSRAIYQEMIKGNKVYLDISMIKNFKGHFPTITEICESNGINIKEGRIPVIPGAHFLMGGIKTDGKGRTTIPGLFAVGEVACTGVHGANRLASNSLLEGIVFGNLVADEILETSIVAKYDQRDIKIGQPKVIQLPTKKDIQQIMMENVGIVREKAKLQEAVKWFENYMIRLKGISLEVLSPEEIMLVNMLTVGWLIASSALTRTESRGGHFRTDYPIEDNHNWYKKEIVRTCLQEEVLNVI